MYQSLSTYKVNIPSLLPGSFLVVLPRDKDLAKNYHLPDDCAYDTGMKDKELLHLQFKERNERKNGIKL